MNVRSAQLEVKIKNYDNFSKLVHKLELRCGSGLMQVGSYAGWHPGSLDPKMIQAKPHLAPKWIRSKRGSNADPHWAS